jgi:hypothetical protein
MKGTIALAVGFSFQVMLSLRCVSVLVTGVTSRCISAAEHYWIHGRLAAGVVICAGVSLTDLPQHSYLVCVLSVTHGRIS